MAYKFQLGAAKLGGAITSTGIISGSIIDSQGALSGSSIQIDDASGLAGAALANSGGALDVQVQEAGGIEISGSALKVKKADNSLFSDAQGLKVKLDVNGGLQTTVDGVSLSASVAGDALSLNSGVLAVEVDDSSIEVNADALRVKGLGITNDMLSGSISNDKLQNSSISNVSLGDSLFALSNGNGISTFSYDGSEVKSVQIQLATTGALEVGASGLDLKTTIAGNRTFSNDITINGNLTVSGTTTRVNSTTINISSSFTFEGPADEHETTLHAGAPTADTTIYLPVLSAGEYYLPAFEADPSGVSLSVTPGELNLLDGGTSVGSSITIQDTDGFIINDGGTMKVIPASDIKDYAVAANALSVASKADGGTLEKGMNYFADLSANATVTLPASPDVGDLVYVKAKGFSNNAKIIVNRAGSQLIDGVESVELESSYAAITLIYVAAHDWRIV